MPSPFRRYERAGLSEWTEPRAAADSFRPEASLSLGVGASPTRPKPLSAHPALSGLVGEWLLETLLEWSALEISAKRGIGVDSGMNAGKPDAGENLSQADPSGRAGSLPLK